MLKSIFLHAVAVSCMLTGAVSADEIQPKSWAADDALFRPFWTSEVIVGESVLFLRDPTTGEAEGNLLFPIENVIEIKRAVDWHVSEVASFEPGRDYVIEKGSSTIRLPQGSRIPSFTADALRRPAGTQKYRLTHRDGNGEIFFGATSEYHEMQVCVTYRRGSADWPGRVPKFDPAALPRTTAKLQREESLSIVLLGDSISTGCNASGWANAQPLQPPYQDLLLERLKHISSAPVSLTNLAVGGTATPWGLTRIADVVAAKPDLVILAFGMNDSSGRPADEYRTNIFGMIDAIRGSLPETEFILVASMLGNADWVTLQQDLFPQYRDALTELVRPGIALADMTSIWSEMLQRKKDADLTGNGVNHPNDFGHRVYAQVLTTLLLPEVASASSGNRDEQQPATPVEPIEVPLWTGKPPLATDDSEGDRAKITVHIPKHPGGSAIVICPGGGYGGLVTGPEGHGIAKWLNSHGVTGVVLEYRLPAGRSAVPLLDAQRAIQTVRARAKEWHLNPSQVGIMGFSAGGHLASTVATHFDEQPQNPSDDAVAILSNRPDFAVLVYPVITMGQHTHGGSRNNLLGANPTAEQIELFSNEKQVTPRTPPVFVTHPIDDQVVPVIHSQQFYTALQAASVPAKYLELPSGGHGLNGYKGPMWDAWQTESLKWLSEQQLIELRKQ
ncbi:MAG: GDSL-type esterase/lipase family protein [Planctomycetota bacterium]